MNKKGLGIVLGFITAVAVGLVWFLIAKYTNYELGIIAIAIGYLVGMILLKFLGKSVQTTALAMLFTFIGLLVAKGSIYYDLVLQETDRIYLENGSMEKNLVRKEIIKEYPFQKFIMEEIKLDKNGMFALLFYFVAFYNAYRVINKKEKTENEDNEDNDTKTENE